MYRSVFDFYPPSQVNNHVKRGCEVGKANGLSILLDAETFDYTYHLKAGEGFKVHYVPHLIGVR